MSHAKLALADGTIYEGSSFGFEGEAEGELVFNTSITGYQEILTDPSYKNQIVVMTYPMIGNYGINSEDLESEQIQTAGLIVKEYCKIPSNWRSTMSLGDYLRENQIVASEGMPTRNIVQKIRDSGAMPAILSTQELNNSVLLERAKSIPTMNNQDLASLVSCSQAYEVPAVGPTKFRLAAIDYGIKRNILRNLSSRGAFIKVFPAKTSAQQILKDNFDGLVLSNGPGDPSAVDYASGTIRKLTDKMPILAICLGHQLLASAFNAKTFKLKFGHRGANQPVKDLITGEVFITSQNHGFAVSDQEFPKELEITQINLNDKTVQAFRHRQLPIISVQYHPEASPGPHDSEFLFDKFIDLLKGAPRLTNAKAN